MYCIVFLTCIIDIDLRPRSSPHSYFYNPRSPVAILERIIELDFLEPMT
jgi:hypothetical protein